MNINHCFRKQLLFFEGAMGTMLQEAGLPLGVLPESWNLEHPEVVFGIHEKYLHAGCHILKTNTFGANGLHFDQVGTVVSAAVTLAKDAVAASGRPDAWVALDIGPTGKLLRPLGDLAFEDAYALFREVVLAGQAAGADMILIETMNDTYELKAAVLAAKENSTLPVMATVIVDERGKMLTGGDVPSVVALLEGLRVDALGLNCGLGPAQMRKWLPLLRSCSSLPIVLQPNAGMPRSENGVTVFDVTPDDFAAEMKELVQNGANAIGGCCGTTPAHLAATIRTCFGLSPLPPCKKQHTVISSYARTVSIGNKPILIGERINPTGKKRLAQALREHDRDYVLQEGIAQRENGAHVLDVNVGLPDVDEVSCLTETMQALQALIDLPLQIDTANIAAMEQAMRLYNGKPLVNSVSGKKESMDAVFPLVKKYGGVVVALTLDETGIPDTAEGRLRIARNILHTAAAYGIDKKDILIDSLAMTISADNTAAAVTLETLRRIKQELKIGTILGVSNISFGLPSREHVSASFFVMALQNGLDAAIINPCADAMMQSYFSFCALTNQDPQCAAYIARYGAASAPVSLKAAGLHDFLVKGLKEQAVTAASALLATRTPLAIIEEELIPALDEVGKGYEQGTLFLPQLLMSAEAAKAAFEVLRAHLTATGAPQETGRKIVLATVRGDIHDIGKNIVKVLLENYGFSVLDLGKDVEVQAIVDTVCREQVTLVGLSALMTTTVASMEQTIRALRTAAPFCKVMVGGAVLTQTYANQIGADFYAKDAIASVHYAQSVWEAI